MHSHLSFLLSILLDNGKGEMIEGGPLTGPPPSLFNKNTILFKKEKQNNQKVHFSE